MSALKRGEITGSAAGHRRRVWKWIGIGALFALIAVGVVGEVLVGRAVPILKGRVIETLSTRFNSRVELDRFHVSIGRGLQVSGGGLRIYPPDDVMTAGATKPLIAVKDFSFAAGFFGLFLKPMHVKRARVSELAIHIPPRKMREQGARRERHGGKVKIKIDEIECGHSWLVIDTDQPEKEPKTFALEHILLRDLGPSGAWSYDAELINAVPKGRIHAAGSFGPWDTEKPGESRVEGHYTFQNANLDPIKGIAGVLHSVGDFSGRLDRIDVRGTADVPAFLLDTAKHPMPLHTVFEAVVDGTSGDTYLNTVKARLGQSSFTCSGEVVHVKGKGHSIALDVNVPAGRIEDFLHLAVRTEPAVMTGVVNLKAKLHIQPGKESVPQKLQMHGTFTLRRIHFTHAEVQDKVDMLSLRARGDPDHAQKGAAADVDSRMFGQFEMNHGRLVFENLEYEIPGATVRLAGVYSLDGRKFDFSGKVRTKAKLSQMVSSWWRSWLLKGLDPFFAKHGAGAEIPVKVTGTRSAPKFGLDLGR